MLEQWIDKNGLIKPQPDWADSGNGVLYTIVYLMVTDWNGLDGFTHSIGKCFKDGKLYRTPPTPEKPYGDYGQEQWDDWLGIAAMCAMNGFHKMARISLWYGVKHFGFYKTSPVFYWKENFKAWLWRFPQVWSIMLVAAFPLLRRPFQPLFKLIGSFMSSPVSDRSGCQLEWVYFRTVATLYPGKFNAEYLNAAQKFKETCPWYYGAGHPTPAAFLARFERERIEGWKCITLT